MSTLSGPLPTGDLQPAAGADGPDAAAISRAAASCASVAEVTGGALDGVATYLPGSRVPGVRITEESVEVHLSVRMSAPSLPAVADEVRSRVQPLSAGRRVDIFIDDVSVEELVE